MKINREKEENQGAQAIELNSFAFANYQQISYQQAKEENSKYKSISELLQDEQMFRLDQDPEVFAQFDSSEDLNNNLELGIGNFDYQILSDDYIPATEEIEMFNELWLGEEMMDKNKEETPSPSPLPVAAQPLPILHIPITSATAIVMPEPTQPVKMEEDNFDLVTFIDSNLVSFTFLIFF